jgi:hypothetical protein
METCSVSRRVKRPRVTWRIESPARFVSAVREEKKMRPGRVLLPFIGRDGRPRGEYNAHPAAILDTPLRFQLNHNDSAASRRPRTFSRGEREKESGETLADFNPRRDVSACLSPPRDNAGAIHHTRARFHSSASK